MSISKKKKSLDKTHRCSLDEAAASFCDHHDLPYGFRVIVKHRTGTKRRVRSNREIERYRWGSRAADDVRVSELIAMFQRDVGIDFAAERLDVGIEDPSKKSIQGNMQLGNVRRWRGKLRPEQLAEEDERQFEIVGISREVLKVIKKLRTRISNDDNILPQACLRTLTRLYDRDLLETAWAEEVTSR